MDPGHVSRVVMSIKSMSAAETFQKLGMGGAVWRAGPQMGLLAPVPT